MTGAAAGVSLAGAPSFVSRGPVERWRASQGRDDGGRVAGRLRGGPSLLVAGLVSGVFSSLVAVTATAAIATAFTAPARAQMSDREDWRQWRDRLGDLFPGPREQTPDEDDAPRASPRGRSGETPFGRAPRREAAPERGDPQDPKAKGGKSAPAQPALTRAEQLDALYERLAKSKDEAEAQGLTRRIERIQSRSGSPTADLLMSRAAIALVRDQTVLAEDLLDRIVDLQPDWADAWMRRGAIRARRDDVSGAVADFGQALRREPRHLGALTGLGFLMLKLERKDEALRVLRRALAVNPHAEPTGKVVKKLAADHDGQAL